MDLEKIRREAGDWARREDGPGADVKLVKVEAVGENQVATFQYVDEDGELLAEATVREAGSYLGRQMAWVDDGNGETLVEALGEHVARMLYI